jgi:hypothetical protein
MAKHKYLYGGLIILGGFVVIVWMKNYLTKSGAITINNTTPNDPLGVGTLTLQPMFSTTINAQPGTTAFPSVLQ